MSGNWKRIFICAFAVASLFSLAGCGVMPRSEWDAPAAKDPVLAMITLDLSDGGRPGGMVIERVDSSGKKVIDESWYYRLRGTDKYILMCEDLTTGTFQITKVFVEVGGGAVEFVVKDNPDFRHTFRRPGIYYVGSYKYRTILPSHMIGKMHFSLDKTRGPSERKVIERLLVAKQLKNQYWKDQLTRRLHELGG